MSGSGSGFILADTWPELKILGFGRAPRIISDVSVFCDFQDLNSARTFSPDQEWLQMADSACDGRWIYLVSVLFLMFGFPVELFQNFRNTFAFVFMSKKRENRPSEISGRPSHLACCWWLNLGISLVSNSDFILTCLAFSEFKIVDFLHFIQNILLIYLFISG